MGVIYNVNSDLHSSNSMDDPKYMYVYKPFQDIRFSKTFNISNNVITKAVRTTCYKFHSYSSRHSTQELRMCLLIFDFMQRS